MLAPRKARGKVIKKEQQPEIPGDIINAEFVSKDVAIEPVKKTPRKGRGAQSMNAKAIKAREKALGEKFVEVTSKLDSTLDKEDGIVVDCFYHAPTKLATVSISSCRIDLI